MKTKICITCKIEKNISEFTYHRDAPDHLRYSCSLCRKIQAHNHYIKNIEKYKIKHSKYRDKNKEKLKILSQKQYEKNKLNKDFKLRKKKYDAEYNKLNYKRKKIYKSIYRKNNIEKSRKSENEYRKKRSKNDINYRIRNILRSRITAAIKNNGGNKSVSSIQLLGCNIQFAREYIESKFKPGMSWNNWKHNIWHIDHIIPCAKFDLTKPEEQKKCFHYTNLQPLWAEENLKKGTKHVA